MLTRDAIVAICPPPKSGTRRLIWDGYTKAILSPEGARLFISYNINTPNRMIGFLGAVCAPETGLTVLWESGAYSAGGILRVFGARHSAKIGAAEAQRIAALPLDERTKVLFERVYGAGNPKKARELGNLQPGDGWRFRGLGLNQMTGRAAHIAAALNVGCTPDELQKPLNLLHAALIEYDEKGCCEYADQGDWVSIRKLINAGSVKVPASRINGIPEALAAVKRAKAVIVPDDVETALAAKLEPLASPPASMAVSTEAQGAVVTGGGGAVTLFQGTQTAIMNATARGDLTAKSILVELLAEPLFWTGLLAILGGAYWYLKRRRNLYLHGV